MQFNFTKNPYFSNSHLDLTVEYDDEVMQMAMGTEIEWIDNPTVIKVKKTQVNRRTKQKRVVEVSKQIPSFF